MIYCESKCKILVTEFSGLNFCVHLKILAWKRCGYERGTIGFNALKSFDFSKFDGCSIAV